MLTYVFWHWPRAGVERAEYESRLRAFHESLREDPPRAFLQSVVFRGGPCSWGCSTEDTYEDWYLTRGTEGLDPLEFGAVNGISKEPHAASARLAAGGCAGLYILRAGEADLARARSSVWFAKPAGVSYAELDAALEPLVAGRGVGVWMRKMTLGPTREMCLMSREPMGLPDRFEGLARPLEPVV